jgi:hypothetical protein
MTKVVDYGYMRKITLPEEKESTPIWVIITILLAAIFLFKRFRDHSLTKVSSLDFEPPESSSL